MDILNKSITFVLIHICGGGGLDRPLPWQRGFFMAVSLHHILLSLRCI